MNEITLQHIMYLMIFIQNILLIWYILKQIARSRKTVRFVDFQEIP